VRLGIAATPIVAAIACSSLVSRALPTPVTDSGVVTWWAFVLIVSTIALVVTDRFARRLLPLSVLLKLSLPFPDAPPSRIKVAIRSGSPKQLERWAASVAASGQSDPKAVAAHDLLGLVTALSVHDRRSRGHSERVRVYTDLMAEQLELSPDDADKLRWAGLLHDVGKISVPSAILNKPAAPDAAEWELIRQHPADGDRLIEPVRAWLGDWSRAVSEHHERWDGSGYPRGLSGHQISLAGRVVAVADSYEVMTATRSYKKPMTAKAARAELKRSAGTHFDPAMVRVFLGMPIRRVGWAAGPIAWVAQLPFLAQIPTWAATAAVTTTAVAATPLMTGVAPVSAAPVNPPPAAVTVTADANGDVAPVEEAPAVQSSPARQPTTTVAPGIDAAQQSTQSDQSTQTPPPDDNPKTSGKGDKPPKTTVPKETPTTKPPKPEKGDKDAGKVEKATKPAKGS
jgi:hypothetical protein